MSGILDPMYMADPAAAVEVFEVPLAMPNPVIATEDDDDDDDEGGVDMGDDNNLDPTLLSSKIIKASTP